MTAPLASSVEPHVEGNTDGESSLAVAVLPHRPKQKKKKHQICRYHGSKHGCRAGSTCPFLHVSATISPQKSTVDKEIASATALETSQRDVVERRVERQPVIRPTPKAQTEDPRAFQVGQIMRRFKPQIAEDDTTSVYTFKMRPSDPDFPYEIDEFECVLSVPKAYPMSGKSTLRVTNKEIPRGFQINIEKGFDQIVSDAPESTLLGLMNRLDRQLETILAGRMADTIKLVANRRPEKTESVAENPSVPPVIEKPTPANMPSAPSMQQKDEARAKRQAHTRQLEARFGRLQSFAKSSDGISYTLPLDSPKKAKWPVPLQTLRSFKLIVPEMYPLETATMHLETAHMEARNVEHVFGTLPSKMQEPTLTQLVNHLSQHISDMAATPTAKDARVPSAEVEKPVEPPSPAISGSAKPTPVTLDSERPHIQIIPRPPEWDFQPGDADGSEDETDSGESGSDDDTAGDTSDDKTRVEEGTATAAPAERGVLLSFPNLELHGIELLELVSLSITVKCERCKDTMDMQKLRNSAGEASAIRQEACKKCATTLAVGFRKDLIHVNSARAGYLDLDGCTVIDMLPSNFIPTCAECSTQYPAPGVVAVRGDSSMAICRECHRKMTFRISEVKFLRISASAMRASKAPGRKKVKENLGITVGSELPRRGRCTHYAKSYRWFRFSCCSKVFPCDRCHDGESDHPVEHANRMLCGFCSREQNYRPEDCATCHAVLIGKRGQGFWEGGKGTRDPTRMSKKDPRKYKRRPGTKPKT